MWHRVVSWLGAQFPPKDPQKAFSRRVRHRLHVSTNLRVLAIDDSDFSLHLQRPGGAEMTMFLNNLYRETSDLDADAATARIDHCLAVLVKEDDTSWATSRERLLPVLRVTTFGAGMGLTLVRRPCVPFVDVHFAVDTPTHTTYVSRERLVEWGIDDDTFFSAVDACLVDLPPVHSTPVSGGAGLVHEVYAEDCHAPSRVLLPGFIRSYERRVEGRPVVAFPQRELLLVTGDADEAGLRYVQETAKRIWEEDPRSISPALYTLDADGRLIPFVPSGEGVLAEDGKLLHQVLAGSEYAASKSRLERAHEASGVDVWVAPFDLRRRDDGTSRSRSLWTNTVATWLPRTDVVSLAQPLSESSDDGLAWIAEVPFESLEARGLLRVVEGESPPRYEAIGPFPTEEEARALPGAELTVLGT